MRTTFSSVAILASSLLAREVLAAPHMHMHKRDVVTDVVVVTEEITVTDDNGVYETAAPAPIGTTTISGTPVTISTTPAATPSSTEAPATSALPASSSSEASTSTSGAVFIQEPKSSKTHTSASSTPKTTAEPTSTSAPVVIPTTSSTSAVIPTTSSAAVETPTTLATSTSSTAPVSTSSSSSSGKKRGLAYNDASLLSGFVSSDSLVSWAYNWASSSATIPSGLEFVPILWGMADSFTSVWNANADAALAAGSTHLMSFNEPDYSGQADLTVDAAVSGYMKYVNPYASKAKIGTPAVTNGGSPMGLTYLGNFVTGLNNAGGTYDFCAIHWYDSATNIAYFKNYMQEAANACGTGKTLWLTEFGASGSADEQNTFLQTVLPWMDEQDYIERYAYFMVAPGNLISSGTSLSTLGNTFASFT